MRIGMHRFDSGVQPSGGGWMPVEKEREPMEENTRHDPHAVLRDPEMLARFERNVRSAGMPRRRFLALASATAGAAALAACGGSSPTVTPAPTKPAATTAPAAASPTTAAGSVA